MFATKSEDIVLNHKTYMVERTEPRKLSADLHMYTIPYTNAKIYKYQMPKGKFKEHTTLMMLTLV